MVIPAPAGLTLVADLIAAHVALPILTAFILKFQFTSCQIK